MIIGELEPGSHMERTIASSSSSEMTIGWFDVPTYRSYTIVVVVDQESEERLFKGQARAVH